MKKILAIALLLTLMLLVGCSQSYDVDTNDVDIDTYDDIDTLEIIEIDGTDSNENIVADVYDFYNVDIDMPIMTETENVSGIENTITVLTESDRASLRENVLIGSGEMLRNSSDGRVWYYWAFGFDYYFIPSHIISIVGNEAFDVWTLQFTSQGGKRDSREASLRTLIEDFGISKEEIIKAREDIYGMSIAEIDALVRWARSLDIDEIECPDTHWEATLWADRPSLSDLEALFSNDVEKMWAAFPGFGVLYEGRVYSPEWLMQNMDVAINEKLIPLYEIARVFDTAANVFSLRDDVITNAEAIFQEALALRSENILNQDNYYIVETTNDTNAEIVDVYAYTGMRNEDPTLLGANVFIGEGEMLRAGDRFVWYYMVFGFDFNFIPSRIIGLVGNDAFEYWRMQFISESLHGWRDSRDATLRTLIYDFGITKEDFISAQEETFGMSMYEMDALITHARAVYPGIVQSTEPSTLSDEELLMIFNWRRHRFSLCDIDALFSNDVSKIWAAFPGLGVYHNGNAYSPEWIMQNIDTAINEKQIPLHEISRVFDTAITTFGYENEEINSAKAIFQEAVAARH